MKELLKRRLIPGTPRKRLFGGKGNQSFEKKKKKLHLKFRDAPPGEERNWSETLTASL